MQDYVQGLDGTLSGCTWVPDGLLFDSDYEHVQAFNGKYLNEEGTFFFLYRQTNEPASFYYFFCLDDDYQEFSFNKAHFDVDDDRNFNINSTVRLLNTTPDILEYDGNWHTVTMAWKDSTNLTDLYVDGHLQEENTATAFTWDYSGADDHDVRIGGRPTSTGRYMGGIAACVYVYDRVLPVEERAWLHREPYAFFQTDRRFLLELGEVQTLVVGPYGVVPIRGIGQADLTGMIGAESVSRASDLGSPELVAVLTVEGVLSPSISAVGNLGLTAIISTEGVERVPVVADPELVAILNAHGVSTKKSVGELSVAVVDVISLINVLRKSGVGEPKLVFVSRYPSGYVFPLVEVDIDLSEIDLTIEVS